MTKKELVFVPAPGMGHLLSTVELAKHIVNRHHEISITILTINLPFEHSSLLNSYVDSQSNDSDSSRLTFISLPSPPSPPDPTSFTFFFSFIDLHKPIVMQTVLNRIKSSSTKPVGFVLDMFCSNMMDVADELNVPSYIYFTSSACLLNISFHFQSLVHDKGVDLGTEFSDPDIELDVPGFRNKVPSKVIPGAFSVKEICQRFLNHVKNFKRNKGILINTFFELESYAVQTLLENEEIPTVYPVGPILELDSKRRSGSRKDDEEYSILQWLDEQPESSVVFLCFGSMGRFSADQVKEIANGLERANHRFLWSLRRPPSENKFVNPGEDETFKNALPEGFLDRTTHIGKVIGWAPQVSILAHRAVGGFVSHCGWNSTLESLWFGVPMATWPMYAEQQLNAFQLVKEMELAVEIRMDYRLDMRTHKGNFLVMAEEVEDGVKKVMSLDKETKEKVREMSERGKRAIEEGGSSYHGLGCFITHVMDNAALVD